MYERLTPRWGKEVGERKKKRKKRSSAHLGVRVVSLCWTGGVEGKQKAHGRQELRNWSLVQSPCKLTN